MLDTPMPIRDVCYLVLGLCAMAGSLYAIFSGRTKTTGDERERIVRIDTTTSKTCADVSDIKAELRNVQRTVSDHERRIIVLEEANKAQWKRIDELKIGGTE